MSDVIEVAQLTKRYGDFTAVDSISFKVSEGEIFGFLGPNGAGKTTTISILCTLLKPTSGHVQLAGFDVVKHRNEVRQSIGLVFQEPALDLKLTAEENLMLHARLYRVPSDVYPERLREVLDLVELWDRRKDKVETFSGGMKRRLEIARGLLHYPKILFLDEPTLGLDPQTRNHLWTYILKLKREKHMTIFLTTHYMNEAEYCDRIGIIDHGKIVRLDTPEKLKDAVGGDVITLTTQDPAGLAAELQAKLQLTSKIHGQTLRIEIADAATRLPDMIKATSTPIRSIEIHEPSLEDVFLNVTGHALRDTQDSSERKRQAFRGMRRGF